MQFVDDDIVSPLISFISDNGNTKVFAKIPKGVNTKLIFHTFYVGGGGVGGKENFWFGEVDFLTWDFAEGVQDSLDGDTVLFGGFGELNKVVSKENVRKRRAIFGYLDPFPIA